MAYYHIDRVRTIYWLLTVIPGSSQDLLLLLAKSHRAHSQVDQKAWSSQTPLKIKCFIRYKSVICWMWYHLSYDTGIKKNLMVFSRGQFLLILHAQNLKISLYYYLALNTVLGWFHGVARGSRCLSTWRKYPRLPRTRYRSRLSFNEKANVPFRLFFHILLTFCVGWIWSRVAAKQHF